MERAEILSNVAEYDPQDETFLGEDFSKFLSKQEQFDFNLTTAINDLTKNVEEELERILEIKFMTDYLKRHDKVRPYLLLHKVFTPTFIYDEMKNAVEKVAWQTVVSYITHLYTNGLLFLKADIIHKASERNIQLFWIPGTPKRMIVARLKQFLQLNTKTSYKQVKANSKIAQRAVKDASVETNLEFAEEQTKKHREKKKLETIEKTTPKKSTKTKKHEEKKQKVLELATKNKPVDYEKKLRDEKIQEELFLKTLSIQEIEKGMESSAWDNMPEWKQELAFNILKNKIKEKNGNGQSYRSKN